MIPKNRIHFIYYCSHPQMFGPSYGEWVYFTGGEVKIWVWDHGIEDFCPSGDDGLTLEDRERLTLGVKRYNFDQGLASFETTCPESQSRWNHLTSFVTLELLSRCNMPINARVSPGTPEDMWSLIGGDRERRKQDKQQWCSEMPVSTVLTAISTACATTTVTKARVSTSTTTSVRKAAQSVDISGSMEHLHLPVFSPFPSYLSASNVEPSEISRITTDRHDGTRRLQALIASNAPSQNARPSSGRDVLGEMQIAFVLFLYLGSSNGLRHWKKIVHLVCTCEKAMLEHLNPELNPEQMPSPCISYVFFERFLDVLRHQLEKVDSDFFIDPLSADNFIQASIQNLFSICLVDNPDSSILREKVERFRQFMLKKFGVDVMGDSPTVAHEDAEVLRGHKQNSNDHDECNQRPSSDPIASSREIGQRMAWMLP